MRTMKKYEKCPLLLPHFLSAYRCPVCGVLSHEVWHPMAQGVGKVLTPEYERYLKEIDTTKEKKPKASAG